jgi:inner membrane protein
MFEGFNAWARRSVTLKLFVIGLLILFLLIPASLLNTLIYERQSLRDQAIAEVSQKWGGNQTIGGPVISVPFTTVIRNDDQEPVTVTRLAYFLPDELTIEGELLPQQRQRGIYVIVLYNTQLTISGRFERFNTDELNVAADQFQWENARLILGLSDMSGVQESITLNWNDQPFAFGPGTVDRELLGTGASVALNLSESLTENRFRFELNLNGSSDLYFMPFGKETSVRLRSSWPDPSFEGTFLPDERTVNSDGFTANWRVLQLNRDYPQQGVGNFINERTSATAVADYPPRGITVNPASRNNTSAFGVRLLLPIDEYKKTERSTKYAMIFILLTFLTYFFIEVLNRRRLHPIQYLLIGAAIILFYILLLSISEHLNFDWAYLIGCVTIISLITGYSWFILRNSRLTALVAGLLAILYGFFYSILQLQDYALLMGSIGLLIILATVMYLTRHVDWYNLSQKEE